MAGSADGPGGGAPDPDLVEVVKEIGRVGVDPVRAGPLELLAAVAAGQQPDAERSGPPRGQQVPDAVDDDDRVRDRAPDERRGGYEQVGVRLGVPNLVSGDERGVLLRAGPARAGPRWPAHWWRSHIFTPWPVSKSSSA